MFKLHLLVNIKNVLTNSDLFKFFVCTTIKKTIYKANAQYSG